MSSEANAHNFTNQVELWKDWNETTTGMWTSILYSDKEAYRDPLDLYDVWMKPGTFFYQWYNATSEAWTWMIGGMANYEQFLKAQYQFIEASMQVSRETSRFVHKVMFPNLQIPTGSDIARLEKVVVSLEERVYTLEDALVSFEDDDLKVGIDQVVGGLVGHLEREEGKLDSVDTLSSILQRTEAPRDLAGHLERVEGKLDRLLAALEKLAASAYPESAWSRDGNEEPRKTQKQCDGTQQVKDTGLEIRQE